MDKIDLGPQGFLYPMPMTLVGADLPIGPNFLAAAWVTRCQPNRPRLVAALNADAWSVGRGYRDEG